MSVVSASGSLYTWLDKTTALHSANLILAARPIPLAALAAPNFIFELSMLILALASHRPCNSSVRFVIVYLQHAGCEMLGENGSENRSYDHQHQDHIEHPVIN